MAMPPNPQPSEPRVADAPPANWADRFAPRFAKPYVRLARLDRPIGVWLLLLPCWWGVGLAETALGQPYPSPRLLLLFALGALLMRASGCAYNDWVDRDYDAKVARTAARPIPSGEVAPGAALAFAAACALLGLMVLIQFNAFTIGLGAASLVLVAVYPFLKRLTYWPQIVLGLAFNWGGLVGWSAVTGSLALPAVLLYGGSVLWTIGYDTIYAHQDKEDDLLLGLKSTAIRFGDDTPTWVGALYAGAVALWLLAGTLAGTHLVFFAAVVLAALQMAWQVTTLDITNAQSCLRRFRSNRDVGLAIFFALAADMIFFGRAADMFFFGLAADMGLSRLLGLS
jgi:4-hydroxybenzoate polyprenyltransferase